MREVRYLMKEMRYLNESDIEGCKKENKRMAEKKTRT